MPTTVLVAFAIPDAYHTFRKVHPIIVQVQRSWLPLTDRNPQKFIALQQDFQNATQRIFRGGADGSRLTLRVIPGPM